MVRMLTIQATDFQLWIFWTSDFPTLASKALPSPETKLGCKPAKAKDPTALAACGNYVEQVMLKYPEVVFSDPCTSTWSTKDCWVTKKGHWREIRVQSVESLEVRCQNSSEANSSTLMDKSNKNIFGKSGACHWTMSMLSFVRAL